MLARIYKLILVNSNLIFKFSKNPSTILQKAILLTYYF